MPYPLLKNLIGGLILCLLTVGLIVRMLGFSVENDRYKFINETTTNGLLLWFKPQFLVMTVENTEVRF